MSLETVHKLVRHHAIRTEVVFAVDAARNRVAGFALAAGAEHRRTAAAGDGEVYQKAGDAARR